MRNLPSDAVAALQSDVVVMAALVQFDLSAPVYACTLRDIAYGGNAYLCNTGLMSVPAIKQDFALSASSLSLRFADPGDVLLAQAHDHGYLDAVLNIHIALMDQTDHSIIHVIPSVYRGYCDDVAPSDDGITEFKFKNHMHKLQRVRGRKTNTASQQRYYPADNAFDQLTATSGDIL